MCLSLCNFFLTNIHGLQVLLGPFLLLSSYSQLPTYPSSVFRLDIYNLFHLKSKQKEKQKATFKLFCHGSSPSYPPLHCPELWMETEVNEDVSC